jgi:hypothetical protein
MPLSIMEIVNQPLTLYPSPLDKGRGKRVLKGASPLSIPLLTKLNHSQKVFQSFYYYPNA